MRIAYFVNAFPTLSETFVLNQITGLLDRGHDVEVIARQSATGPHHSDIERYGLVQRTRYRPEVPAGHVRRVLKALGIFAARGVRSPILTMKLLDFRRFGRLAYSLELFYAAAPLFRAGRYDAIHCHFAPNGMVAATLREAGVLHGRLVTTVHAYGLSRYTLKWGDRVYERLFETGDLFLPVSQHGRRRLMDLGCDDRKIRIHRMGVDCCRFAPTQRCEREGGAVRVISIGRLVEKKGFAFAIRAVADLKKRGVRCSYRIVGDGPLVDQLKTLIRALAVEDCVELLGSRPQDKVAELLSSSDVFVAPSVTAVDGDEEGIPVVLMEAMAVGLPVVSTVHAGISELVADGVTGYLVPERDVNSLAEKLETLLSEREARRRMGRAGREVIEREFNIEKLNDQLVEILR